MNKEKELVKISNLAFSKLATAIGDETYQIVREGDTWYEQLMDDETIFRHKLLTIKCLSIDLLNKKAKSSCAEPGRIKESQQGATYAFVWLSNTVLFYCLISQTRHGKTHALQLVTAYAQSLAARKKTQIQACAAHKEAA